MRKKWLLFLLISLIGTIYFLFPKPPSPTSFCAFCEPTVLERQTFYEDELVLALYTHRPIFPGHCLIIPKRHVERFEMLTEEEMAHINKVITKVNRAVTHVFGTFPYFLHQKNGTEVGQSVPHVHVHYVPRKTGDSSIFQFVLKMCIAYIKRPISPSEMHEAVEKLRAAQEHDRV